MYIDVHYYTYTGYPNAYYPDALINIAYDKAHYPNGFPAAKGKNQGSGSRLPPTKEPSRATIRAK